VDGLPSCLNGEINRNVLNNDKDPRRLVLSIPILAVLEEDWTAA
jgi:hypothetical protein